MLGSCRQYLEPTEYPPYLAILATVVSPGRADAATRYHYHVRELSGTLGIDTVYSVLPQDTLTLSLPSATYVIELSGVPPQCRTNDLQRVAFIAPGTNTTVVRYFVVCQAELTVSVLTDGAVPDPLFVYHLATSDGRERIGLLNTDDTLELNGLPSGPATFDLADVAQNCIVTSDGGGHRTVDIDSVGGASIDFVVGCADPAHRPQLQALHATYRKGVVGLVFHGGDPDRDIDRYYWDLTDCRRTSLLPGGRRLIGGLHEQVSRTYNQDTITVVGAFDVGLPDADLRSRCAVLWLADSNGNPSNVIETFLGGSGAAPTATVFNGHLLGTVAVRTDLATEDVDGDYLGLFVMYRRTTGARVVIGTMTPGVLGSTVPDATFDNVYLTYGNVAGVIVYLLDAQGNVTRLEDDDLFH